MTSYGGIFGFPFTSFSSSFVLQLVRACVKFWKWTLLKENLENLDKLKLVYLCSGNYSNAAVGVLHIYSFEGDFLHSRSKWYKTLVFLRRFSSRPLGCFILLIHSSKNHEIPCLAFQVSISELPVAPCPLCTVHKIEGRIREQGDKFLQSQSNLDKYRNVVQYWIVGEYRCGA